jgi:hypothetical protein
MRGSAFNANGVAPSVYAVAQPQNSKNPKSVAHYDVACFQVSQTHKQSVLFRGGNDPIGEERLQLWRSAGAYGKERETPMVKKLH